MRRRFHDIGRTRETRQVQTHPRKTPQMPRVRLRQRGTVKIKETHSVSYRRTTLSGICHIFELFLIENCTIYKKVFYFFFLTLKLIKIHTGCSAVNV